ncbi:MAG: peptide chain release factor N(5)-glutamine methyltransferase [Bergeyella sp.]
MTILQLKNHFKSELSEWYSESESAFLYSVFVEKIVGFSTYLQRKFMHQELLVSDEEQLKTILAELKTGKPYQHISGETEFYGMKFFVNENVLIPRPETEELIEFSIRKIQDLKFKVSSSNLKPKTLNVKLLDIGTGSGIIPIVLKKHFPEAEISAIDISEKALERAKKNAEFHQTEIRFLLMDFLNEPPDEKFDIIISNPPYIGIDEKEEISDSVKNFEPENALFSPVQDTLIFYRRIAEYASEHLTENGVIFLEINQKLGKETAELFQNFSESRLLQDISGNDRIVFAVK